MGSKYEKYLEEVCDYAEERDGHRPEPFEIHMALVAAAAIFAIFFAVCMIALNGV